MKKSDSEVYEIDLVRLIKLLWHNLWVIVLCVVVSAGTLVSYAKFLVSPQYSASIMVYVNNSAKISAGTIAARMSSSDLSAAQGLVDTYIVILGTHTTLDRVIAESKLDYSYSQLSSMISAEAVNSTEIFRITVTAGDPKKAQLLANTIATVLPKTISEIVEGSSARIVDNAVLNKNKVSPSIVKFGAIGVLLGLLLGCAIAVLRDIFDDIIRNEDYLLNTYDAPVLAVIPDLTSGSASAYKYGYGSKSSGKGRRS